MSTFTSRPPDELYSFLRRMDRARSCGFRVE
jgi:hypothetical protein